MVPTISQYINTSGERLLERIAEINQESKKTEGIYVLDAIDS